MRRLKNAWFAVRSAFLRLIGDDAFILSASLAYWTTLSLAPLLLLLVWGVGLLGHDLQQRLVDELVRFVGPQVGDTIRGVVQSTNEAPSLGGIAGWSGLGTLILGATAVFAQLQYALDRVWNVQPRPRGNVWAWVRKRILSLGMILAVGFLLLVSLAISTALSMLGSSPRLDPQALGPVWMGLNAVLSLVVVAALFAAMFYWLPDVEVSWRDVVVGALITSCLFAVGKAALGLYLGRGGVGSAYGAAGSLIVLLVWVYYSALIFLYGAELTQIYATHFGRGMRPEEHASWRTPPERWAGNAEGRTEGGQRKRRRAIRGPKSEPPPEQPARRAEGRG